MMGLAVCQGQTGVSLRLRNLKNSGITASWYGIIGMHCLECIALQRW